MWTRKGVRPVVTMTGSHQKTCVFGVLIINGIQFFRQHSTYDQDTFLQYLEELQRKFRKLILFFLDRAAQHYRSIKVRKNLEENKNVIRIAYLPKGYPEFNAEECWREGKDDLLVSRYYPKFQNLMKAIAEYYRTKRFRLNITDYLLRGRT